MDKLAHRPQVAPQLGKECGYGRLKKIFVVEVPDIPQLKIAKETVILVSVQVCTLTTQHTSLNICYFRHYESSETVFDITCLECLVGRVPTEDKKGLDCWAIIDRSSDLDRVLWLGEGI